MRRYLANKMETDTTPPMTGTVGVPEPQIGGSPPAFLPGCPTDVAASSSGVPSPWECTVCHLKPEQLHVLPCQHKFCARCLQLWVGIYVDMYRGPQGRFPCQICWATHPLPDNGLDGFLQDYALNSLQAGFGDLTLTSSTHALPQGQDQGQFSTAAVMDSMENASSSCPPQPMASHQAPTIIFDHFGSISYYTDIVPQERYDNGQQAQATAEAELRTPGTKDYCYRSGQLPMHMM